MAFRRKFKRFAKKQYGNRKKWRSTASQALKVALAVKSMLNVELKSYDKDVATTITTTPSVTLLTGIDQGDTSGTRDGKQVRLKSLTMKGTFCLNTNADDDRIKYIIVQTKNNEVPTWAYYFKSNAIDSLRNLNNTRDTKILKTGFFTMDQDNKRCKTFSVHLKLNNVAQWNIATNDERIGHIYFLALGSNVTYPTDHLYESRIRYVDN